MTELFINSIDLSPYIVEVSLTGNVIGIKAPPELLSQMFLDLRISERKAVIYYNGKLLRWASLNADEWRGWLYIEIRKVNHRGIIEPSSLWLRFDE